MKTRTPQVNEQKIGWQGLTVNVFEDWSVVGYSGDEQLGSIRIDGGGDWEADTISGLDIRWSTAKKRPTNEELRARIKPLLHAGGRKMQAGSVYSEPMVRPFDDSKYPERDISIDFSWKKGQAGHGRIFHCITCGRIVVAQCYGTPGQPFTRLSEQVLASIACHSTTLCYKTWGLYGLLIDVPSDCELIQQLLMNVYLQLTFQRKNSSEQLMIEQWSLANIQLKGSYLDEWYDLKSVGWTEGVSSRKTATTVNGHPALSITGRREIFPAKQIELIKQYSKLRHPAFHYTALLWECPESNKAYLIQEFAKIAGSGVVKDCAAKTSCHGVKSPQAGTEGKQQ